LPEKKENMRSQPNGTRCKARTKSGKPCRAAATEGGLCFFHANPSKAAELGRIGGRKNRYIQPGTTDSLPSLDTAQAVRDTVARLITDVYSGKLSPKIATGLAPLLNLQLRAIDITDLQRRLANLEKLFADEHQERDPDSHVAGSESDWEHLDQSFSETGPGKNNDGASPQR
jgi:hypothetical protein